jgi:large conductance mechanosensitive channel
MGMIKEFKDFAVKGNLVDVAVAFVMGAAFGKVITSFTGGIVSPLISIFTGGRGLSKKEWIIKEGSKVTDAAGAVVEEIPAVTVKYGEFIMATLDFMIVAFVMFMLIKTIAKVKAKKEEAASAPAGPSSTDALLMEIRDALKK